MPDHTCNPRLFQQAPTHVQRLAERLSLEQLQQPPDWSDCPQIGIVTIQSHALSLEQLRQGLRSDLTLWRNNPPGLLARLAGDAPARGRRGVPEPLRRPGPARLLGARGEQRR